MTTYEDLADPTSGRAASAPARALHDYNVALLAAVIAHHGEEAATTWAEGLKANLARKPDGGDRDQVKAIAAGECDIALGNTYYMGQMLADPEQMPWAESVNIVFPTFENGGTHLNISGVAMTKAAPNQDNALKFMEWLSSRRRAEDLRRDQPRIPGQARRRPLGTGGKLGRVHRPTRLPLTEIAAAASGRAEDHGRR